MALVAMCAALLTVPMAGSAQAGTYTRIKTAVAEKCLGINDFGRGYKVEVAKCARYSQEFWFVETLFSDRVRLRSADQDSWNECIDAVLGKGKQLVMVGCDGSADQAFIKRFIPHSSTFFTLESARYRGLCADVKDWGASNVVQLWDCHGKSNQVWWYW